MGERVLRQMEEDIALILLGVKPAFQQVAASFLVVGAPGVMPSRHVVEIQLAAALLQGVEFHVAVQSMQGLGVRPQRYSLQKRSITSRPKSPGS